MKNIALFIIILFAFSCTKENENYQSSPENNFPNIEIDSISYSYISSNNEYYYNGIFNSKEHIQKFNLTLKKNRKYRISSSQIYNENSTIGLSLLRGDDTITISQWVNNQPVLYFNSSSEQKLTLQAKLQSEYNISLDYRLFFEELNYDTLKLNNYLFSYNGHYRSTTFDSICFYPSNSYWHRWMRLEESISNTAEINYTFKTDVGNLSQEFGFLLSDSKELSRENQYDDDLPNGLYFSVTNQIFTVSLIDDFQVILLERGNLNFSIDYDENINLKIVTDQAYNNKKEVYINNNIVTYLDSPSQNFLYLVYSDRAKENIQLFNFSIN